MFSQTSSWSRHGFANKLSSSLGLAALDSVAIIAQETTRANVRTRMRFNEEKWYCDDHSRVKDRGKIMRTCRPGVTTSLMHEVRER